MVITDAGILNSLPMCDGLQMKEIEQIGKEAASKQRIGS